MIKDEGYCPRLIDAKMEGSLATHGAVLLEGVKGCGKTRTANLFAKSTAHMEGVKASGASDAVVAQILAGASPRLLDEWQYVPQTGMAAKNAVDKGFQNGRFILDNSWEPEDPAFGNSRRIARLRMRPMSLYESGDSNGLVSLQGILNGMITTAEKDAPTLQSLIGLIIRGGWPSSLAMPEMMHPLIPQAYLEGIVASAASKDEQELLWKILRSLARNESKAAPKSEIIEDLASLETVTLDADTLSAKLELLKRHFVTDNQPAFQPKVRSFLRMRLTEKLHLADPSLACGLLGATPESLKIDTELTSRLFEAMCIRDLRIYTETLGGKVLHYQDLQKRSAAAIVQMPDGSWSAFEFKLNGDQIEGAASRLQGLDNYFALKEGNAPRALCVICGVGGSSYRRSDGVFVAPITSLKP